jgi:predicted amidohydrolase YtcJ
VRDHLAEHPGALVGYGHRLGTWTTDPTVAMLDAVAPDVPVVLIAGDAHHAWLNSRALERLGLPVREGLVLENEWYDAHSRIDLVAEPDLSPAAYRRTLDAAAALGITGIVDLERGQLPADWGSRDSPIRVRVSTYAEGLDHIIDAGLRSGDPLVEGQDLLVMGPLKVISDGSLNTRSAWCEHPYADGSGSGAPNQSPAELRALMTRATEHGLETAIHAIGDAACHDVLAAYEETGARGSMEHAQLMTRADVTRMGRLGVRASVQPAHLLDDRDVSELIWPDRTDRCFPLRWMLDDGVPLAFGSDAPVSPLDPWLAIAAAVHRSADDRPAWHGEQAVTPREALAASVDGQGSVHAGARGDLVLLDADPLDDSGTTADQAARLRAMPVAATWVAGRLVHGDEGLFGG